jgi:hypothetical protein
MDAFAEASHLLLHQYILMCMSVDNLLADCNLFPFIAPLTACAHSYLITHLLCCLCYIFLCQQLDALQAYHLLETYLHLYHNNNGAHLSSSGGRDSSSVTLMELISHYYTERTSLLLCLAALFRIYLDDAHVYHKEVTEILRVLCMQGLEEQLLQRLKEASETKLPGTVSSAAAAADSSSADKAASSTLLQDDPELASKFADQTVTEQALLLELLFLLYYDNDEFSGAEPATAAADGATATALAAQTRMMRFYSLLQSSQFNRVQPLYPFLSARGRQTVEWLGHLGVIIAIEIISFEKLMRVYNYPLADMKAYIAQRRQTHGGSAHDDELYERNRAAAISLLDGADLTFREHAFSDSAFLASMDQTFFESDWNPKAQAPLIAGQALPLCGPLNLAWAVALSHVYEYLEDVQMIKQEFDLLGVDPDTNRPIIEVADFSTERQIIIQRLEASLCCQSNPFALMAGMLASIQTRSKSNEYMSANLPAFKEIFHELLTSLFDSSCYSALTSIGGSTLNPLYPLFTLIFHEDAALCYRFWQTDERNPQDRSPLLEQALARCPFDIAPFLQLLNALAGKTVQYPLRFDGTGEAYESTISPSDTSDADSAVCANRVFDALRHMKFFSSAQPPEQLIRQLDPQEQYNLLLTQSWTTSDKYTLPANTFGRFVAGSGTNSEPRLVQWWHSYSAWPLLLERVESCWRELRASRSLTAKTWSDLSLILQLLAKLVKADLTLYTQLIEHLQELGGDTNDTALSLYAPNASFSTQGGQQTPQRDLALMVLLMRIQAYITLHSASILTSANSKQQDASRFNQTPVVNQSMDTSFESSPVAPPQLSAPAAITLTLTELFSLSEACSSLLIVGARYDLQRWLRAYQFVIGGEMSNASSVLYVDATQTNLFNNIALTATRSPAQATYNGIQLCHRALLTMQIQMARYTLLATFMEHVSTLILPLYQISTIQNVRAYVRSNQKLFAPSHVSRIGVETVSALPINTSLTPFLNTFDMHQLLKYVCESVFVSYDEWRYADRTERWTLGSQLLRFFLLILSHPSAGPSLSTGGSNAASALHSISIQQYLYTLFLTEPSMLLALLRPLLLGLSLLDRLNYDRQHDTEVVLLQDLLAHTFLVLQRLMDLEGQRASVATGAGTTKPASFYNVLLETVAAAHTPPAWRYVSRRKGGRFSNTPVSLLHAITEYANYARSAELQSLAIQTLRLLCAGGQAGSAATNLAAHFQPRTLLLLRRTCLLLLTGHTTELTLRIQLLQLLTTLFEKQSGVAQCFVSSTSALTGDVNDEEDDEEEDGDRLFQLLAAYISMADEQLQGDLQSLHFITRIVAAIWQSAVTPSVALSDFKQMQQRLRKEVPSFWAKLTVCLTAESPKAIVSPHSFSIVLSLCLFKCMHGPPTRLPG